VPTTLATTAVLCFLTTVTVQLNHLGHLIPGKGLAWLLLCKLLLVVGQEDRNEWMLEFGERGVESQSSGPE
jgi:hypothetical protein